MKIKTAVKLAIEALIKDQRQYNAGHRSFLDEGELFEFAKRDHNQWQKRETAKGVLRQMENDLQQTKMMFGTRLEPVGSHETDPFAAQDATTSPPSPEVQEGSK